MRLKGRTPPCGKDLLTSGVGGLGKGCVKVVQGSRPIYDLKCLAYQLGSRVQGPWFIVVQASGFWVQGSGFAAQGSGFGVRGLGFKVQGSGGHAYWVQSSGGHTHWVES